MIASPPSAPQPARRRRPWLIRVLVMQVFCLAIALLVWWFPAQPQPFLTKWLYSVAIGNCCWVFIDGGRAMAAAWVHRAHPDSPRREWPGTAFMALIVLLGGAAGYTVGATLGDALTGHRSANFMANQKALLLTCLAGVLATAYYYASERLHQERAAAESARRLALENQLRLLESQLEPHMLFNTLANLRVLIGLDPPRAQAMLDRLIAFLRATLEASHLRMHPLATEFERLADYLALMAVRMGPRLQFTLALPEPLRAHPIPPLLLQPLVENAIKHGLEPQVAGGRVTVSARLHEGQLCIEVRDTGVGVTMPAEPGLHFGTRQIAERLQAVYAGAARFTLQPAGDAEGGTLARITLPTEPPP